ncbi:hypothetical protein BC941DRAFT_442514 [Chlamydoabsidia padenii]|nr:hypothetical protein BC941DRAFT_442514 [Chlamydoabsidia padenii]
MMAETASLKSTDSTDNLRSQLDFNTNTNNASPPQKFSHHQQTITTLQEAFPSVESSVIEAVLENQHGNVESSFEVLLGMSDPDYQAPTDDDRYALEQQEKEDALLAKQLAQEYNKHQQRQQRQQQQQDNTGNTDSVFSGFQEELPVIKERVIEVGNAAKKKIMGFYNSFMEQGSSTNPNNHNSNYYNNNNRYQDGLTNDMRGLRLSSDSNLTPGRTSTHEQQLDDDAAFARRLAMEDAHLERLSAQRLKQQQQQQQQEPYEKKGMHVEEGKNRHRQGLVDYS